MKLLEGQECPWLGIMAMCHTLTWKQSVNSSCDYFSGWNSSTDTCCADFSLELLGMLIPLHPPQEFSIPRTWNVCSWLCHFQGSESPLGLPSSPTPQIPKRRNAEAEPRSRKVNEGSARLIKLGTKLEQSAAIFQHPFKSIFH